jgi:hypothetical protein
MQKSSDYKKKYEDLVNAMRKTLPNTAQETNLFRL